MDLQGRTDCKRSGVTSGQRWAEGESAVEDRPLRPPDLWHGGHRAAETVGIRMGAGLYRAYWWRSNAIAGPAREVIERDMSQSLRRQVKILHLTDNYPPTMGGLEWFVQSLATVQAEAGHSVTVVTTELPGQPARSVQNGVTVVRLPFLLRRLPSLRCLQPSAL